MITGWGTSYKFVLIVRLIEGERVRVGDCVVLPKGIETFLCKGHQNSRPKDSFVVCRGTLTGDSRTYIDLDLVTVSFCHMLIVF